MFNNYKYQLSKSSKKYFCPNCHKKRFVKYIDAETGEYLPDQYGRCDREINCPQLEYNNPYLDGYAKAIWKQEQCNKTNWKSQHPKRKKKPLNKPKRAFIPLDVFNRTRAGYEQNSFIQNLLTRVAFPFEVQDIEKVISMYHLGTVQNGYRTGANTFPFIDVRGNIRAVQVKQFDKQNNTTGTDFLHSIIEKHHTRNNKPLPEWLEAYNKNETKVSCLFGEHLLSKYPYNPVALVEAPKTAIYSSLYFGFPEQPTNFLWLAVYNLSSLSLTKCKVLEGRDVYLFPDLSKDGRAFELWSNRANEMQRDFNDTYFTVSDLLEQYAPFVDKEKGKDIADYLIEQDWRLFRSNTINQDQNISHKPETSHASEKGEKSEPFKKTFSESHDLSCDSQSSPIKYANGNETLNWDQEIEDLEDFFKSITMPKTIKLDNASGVISDCNQYVNSHLLTLKANNGKELFLPYLNRLQKLKQLLS